MSPQPPPPRGGEQLLFLTDDQLRRGIEAMFFAYRGFTADPDRILAARGYGRAHHRAVHFINRSPGTTVGNLLAILGVTKQSLNRVLRSLIEDGLVEARIGTEDRRERNLHLTPAGAELERALSDAQRARMRAAYRAAGPVAVAGFRQVLEAMMDADQRTQFQGLSAGPGQTTGQTTAQTTGQTTAQTTGQTTGPITGPITGATTGPITGTGGGPA
jgi:DNA-binding MarR family transcriptional regulator